MAMLPCAWRWTRAPQLVISGMALAGLNGLALARAIRRTPKLDATPVIIMSSCVGETEALAAGATQFLQKPFGLTELQEKVSLAVAL